MKMKLLKLFWAGLAVTFAAFYPLSGFADTAKPEVLVEQRQAAMTLMGKYFGQLGAIGKGQAPYDAGVVTRNAAYLEVLAKMPWDGFDPSTKGQKSDALPAVYSDTAKFKEAQGKLQEEVAKLVSATKGGNEGAVKTQIGAVAKTCGGCHKSFRAEHK